MSKNRFLWLVALTVVSLASANGAPPDQAERVEAHLAAGEFGLARNAAMGAPAAARDRLLGRVSSAQAASGARLGSLSTARSIADQQVRSEALDRIADQPVGEGAAGGAALADFDSLIDLITATIAPESWDDVGGPGSVQPFPTGVWVNASGLLQKTAPAPGGAQLATLRANAAVASGNTDYRRQSAMRKVSLNRLEREVHLLHAQGRSADDVMQTLAGIYKIKHVFVYPETGDIVLAGPAGDWTLSQEGRPVNVKTRRPTLRLDDLVVVLRSAMSGDGVFGCAITPRKENLARTKAYLAEWAKKPLKPHQREKWVAGIRESLDRQDIDVWGIDPGTRAAQVLVEADYRMKLVGMGLEDGVLGVTSYLDSLKVGEQTSMSVLRWWFTLNHKAVTATEARDAFEIHGQAVKVLSENEMLTDQGERVHTGKSSERNSEFAHTFTKHFPQLAAKYPIYADLANIFDIALVSALLRSEELPGQVGWRMTHFGPEGSYAPAHAAAPKEVMSVVNHRVLDRKHIVAGASGGVKVDARALVRAEAIATDTYGAMKAGRQESTPDNLPAEAWWWD